MKKTSDRVASRVAKFTLGVGLIAAILCPFAGAGLAAWSTGAAAIGSLGAAAGIPLAGAGAVGGFILGSIAAPFVAIGSVVGAAIAGGTTKAIGSLVEWMASGGKDAHATPPATDAQRHIDFDRSNTKTMGMKIASAFLKAQKPANHNKPQPQYNKAFKFGM